MAFPSDLKHVQVNGVDLAYHETGSVDLPNMVLVHGHISDLRSWSALQKLLTPYFHVISYSRRYALPNAPIGDTEGESWEQHALDLAGLIENLNLAPCHVVGNSSGATILLLLAQSHPCLLKSIILEEPPIVTLFMPRMPPTLVDVLSLLWNYPWAFLPLMMFGATTVGPAVKLCKAGDYDAALEIFGPGACGQGAWDKMKKDPARMAQAKDNLKWYGNFSRYSQMPVITVEDVRKINIPAVVMTGADTIPAGKRNDWLLARELAGCKREVIIDGAWHLMHEDQPERVMMEIAAFVESCAESSSMGTSQKEV